MLRTILVLFPALAFAMPATSSADEPRIHEGFGQNVGKDIEQEMNFCVDLLQGVTQNRSCEVLSADECLAACDIAATGDDAARSCRSSCNAGAAMFCSTARWGGGYDQGFGKPGVGKPGIGKPGFGKPVGPGQGLTPLEQEIEQELVQELEQELEQGFGKPNVGKDETLIEQLEQGMVQDDTVLEQVLEQELEQGMVQDDTLLEQEMVQELVQDLEQGVTQDLEQELIQDLEQGIGKNIGKDHNIGKPGFGKRWGKYDQGFGKDVDQSIGKYDQDLEQELLQELEQELEQHFGKDVDQGIGKYEQGIGKYDQNIGKPGFGKRWGKYDQGFGKGELIYVDVTECEMLIQDLEQGVGKGVGKHTFGK